MPEFRQFFLFFRQKKYLPVLCTGPKVGPAFRGTCRATPSFLPFAVVPNPAPPSPPPPPSSPLPPSSLTSTSGCQRVLLFRRCFGLALGWQSRVPVELQFFKFEQGIVELGCTLLVPVLAMEYSKKNLFHKFKARSSQEFLPPVSTSIETLKALSSLRILLGWPKVSIHQMHPRLGQPRGPLGGIWVNFWSEGSSRQEFSKFLGNRISDREKKIVKNSF